MEAFKHFISDLAGDLHKDYGLSPEAAQAEAERVEAQNRRAIGEAMSRGFGIIIFCVAFHELEATFSNLGMTRLRRLRVVMG